MIVGNQNHICFWVPLTQPIRIEVDDLWTINPEGVVAQPMDPSQHYLSLLLSLSRRSLLRHRRRPDPQAASTVAKKMSSRFTLATAVRPQSLVLCLLLV